MTNGDHDKQLARQSAMLDVMEDQIRRIDRVLQSIDNRCADKHAAIQRDIGNIQGRATGVSALVAFIVSVLGGIVAWLIRQ